MLIAQGGTVAYRFVPSDHNTSVTVQRLIEWDTWNRNLLEDRHALQVCGVSVPFCAVGYGSLVAAGVERMSSDWMPFMRSRKGRLSPHHGIETRLRTLVFRCSRHQRQVQERLHVMLMCVSKRPHEARPAPS